MIRLCIAIVLLASHCVRAHPTVPTVAVVRVSQAEHGGVVEVIITHDALAYALNDTSARVMDWQMYELLEGPADVLAAALQDGRERFSTGFDLIADGERVPFELVGAPTLEAVEAWKEENPSLRLPVTMDFVFRAKLPADAVGLSIRAPHVLDEVFLVAHRPGTEALYLPLGVAELSPAIDVSMVGMPGFEPDEDPPAAEPIPPAAPSVSAVGWRYLVLGYRHIVPEGTDHQLFILALFLLNTRFRDLLLQTSIFTLAHTCTLALASLDAVRVSPEIVEPVIAGSIAFVAIENLFVTEARPWRGATAFVFGLAHGLGFGTELNAIGLPRDQLVLGLVGFSVGVESGHATILLVAFGVLGWWRAKGWYRTRVTLPLSALIAVIALLWLVQRL